MGSMRHRQLSRRCLYAEKRSRRIKKHENKTNHEHDT